MNAAPLIRKSKFEDVVATADLPPFRLTLPDRYARFIAESPVLAVLEEDLNEQQKRVAEEQVRDAELLRVAQETGAPQQLIKQLQKKPAPFRIEDNDQQIARAMALQLDEHSQEISRAELAVRNVSQVAQQARDSLSAAHKGNALHSLESSVQFFDIGEDGEDIPYLDAEDVPVYSPDLHLPATPYNRMARRLGAAPSDRELLRAANALREAGMTETPMMDAVQAGAEGVMQVARVGGSAAASVAQTVGPPLGSMAIGTVRGIASATPYVTWGARNVTSHAARSLTTALQRAQALGLPMEKRAAIVDGMSVSEGLGHFIHSHQVF